MPKFGPSLKNFKGSRVVKMKSDDMVTRLTDLIFINLENPKLREVPVINLDYVNDNYKTITIDLIIGEGMYSEYKDLTGLNINYFMSDYVDFHDAITRSFGFVEQAIPKYSNGKLYKMRYVLSLDEGTTFYKQIWNMNGVVELLQNHGNRWTKDKNGKYIVDLMNHPSIDNCDNYCVRFNNKKEIVKPYQIYDTKHIDYDLKPKNNAFFQVNEKNEVTKQVRGFVVVGVDNDKSGNISISVVNKVANPLKIFLFPLYDDFNAELWLSGIKWIQENGYRIKFSNIIGDIIQYENLVPIKSKGGYESSSNAFNETVSNGIVNRSNGAISNFTFTKEQIVQDIQEPHLNALNHEHFELSNVNKGGVSFDTNQLFSNKSNFADFPGQQEVDFPIPWFKPDDDPTIHKVVNRYLFSKTKDIRDRSILLRIEVNGKQKTIGCDFPRNTLNKGKYFAANYKVINDEHIVAMDWVAPNRGTGCDVDPPSNGDSSFYGKQGITSQWYNEGAPVFIEQLFNKPFGILYNGSGNPMYGYDQYPFNTVTIHDECTQNSSNRGVHTQWDKPDEGYKFKKYINLSSSLILNDIVSMSFNASDMIGAGTINDTVIAFDIFEDNYQLTPIVHYVKYNGDVYMLPLGQMTPKIPSISTMEYFGYDENVLSLTKNISFISPSELGIKNIVLDTDTSGTYKLNNNNSTLNTSGVYDYPYFEESYVEFMKNKTNQFNAAYANNEATRKLGIKQSNQNYWWNAAMAGLNSMGLNNQMRNEGGMAAGAGGAELAGGMGGFMSFVGGASVNLIKNMLGTSQEQARINLQAKNNRNTLDAQLNDAKNLPDNIGITGTTSTLTDTILKQYVEVQSMFKNYGNFGTPVIHKMELTPPDKYTVKMYYNKYGYTQDRLVAINDFNDLAARGAFNQIKLANATDLIQQNNLNAQMLINTIVDLGNGVSVGDIDKVPYDEVLDYTINNYEKEFGEPEN